MATHEQRLRDLVAAIGADVKALQASAGGVNPFCYATDTARPLLAAGKPAFIIGDFRPTWALPDDLVYGNFA